MGAPRLASPTHGLGHAPDAEARQCALFAGETIMSIHPHPPARQHHRILTTASPEASAAALRPAFASPALSSRDRVGMTASHHVPCFSLFLTAPPIFALRRRPQVLFSSSPPTHTLSLQPARAAIDTAPSPHRRNPYPSPRLVSTSFFLPLRRGRHPVVALPAGPTHAHPPFTISSAVPRRRPDY